IRSLARAPPLRTDAGASIAAVRRRSCAAVSCALLRWSCRRHVEGQFAERARVELCEVRTCGVVRVGFAALTQEAALGGKLFERGKAARARSVLVPRLEASDDLLRIVALPWKCAGEGEPPLRLRACDFRDEDARRVHQLDARVDAKPLERS